MSGIAGIYNIDRRPVDETEIQVMLDTMAHRGPDGRGQWLEEHIAFGHCLLHTTQESLLENLPYTSDNLTITADARIDNRESLFSALAIPPELQSQMTDSELILQSYRCWGANCLSHLLGDFAFAIWDANEKRLFCARDHFGLKPIYYFHDNNRFIFATEVQAILSVLPSKPVVNEQKIVNWIIHDYVEKKLTFFKDIFRLLPAHFLVIDTSGNEHFQEYWKLDPEREIPLKSFDECAEQFREIFTEAVRCRLRSAHKIGSLLSGGMDSSSVTCVARDLLRDSDPNGEGLATYSGTTPTVPISDERVYQDMVIAAGGVEPYFFRSDEANPLGDLSRRFKHLGHPITGGNDFQGWNLCEVAHQQGVRIILSGEGGDNVVSYGEAIAREWTVKRDWASFRQELGYIAKIFNTTEIRAYMPMFQKHITPALQALADRGELLGALRRLIELENYFGFSKTVLLKDVIRVFFPKTTAKLQSLRRYRKLPDSYTRTFTSDAIQRYQLRHKDIPFDPTKGILDPRHYQYHELSVSYAMEAMENVEAKGAAFQLEVRSPFCDIRLMEFCLAVPARYKIYEGFARAPLRAAMKGILPEGVRLRPGKSNLQPNFYRGLKQENAQLIQTVKEHISELMPYIDAEFFRDSLDRYLDSANLDRELYVWPILSAAVWLYYLNYVNPIYFR